MRLAHIFICLSLSSASSFGTLAQQSTPPPAPPAAPAELPDAPASNAPVVLQPTGPTAVFDTSMGRITCKLFATEAPETVANFIGLADGTKDWTDPTSHKKMHHKPLYNGTVFHRVITEVPTEHLNQHHTIFGQCDDASVNIVKSIARVQRDSNDKPITDVVLTKVTIVPDGKPLPPAPVSSAAPAPAKP
jgi:peptidyl-prolyl cis-trans isomerase A (cyclophilin A)